MRIRRGEGPALLLRFPRDGQSTRTRGEPTRVECVLARPPACHRRRSACCHGCPPGAISLRTPHPPAGSAARTPATAARGCNIWSHSRTRPIWSHSCTRPAPNANARKTLSDSLSTQVSSSMTGRARGAPGRCVRRRPCWWQVAGGRWQVAGGRWQVAVAGGRWRCQVAVTCGST
eukprot:1177216-Prorocentrum_minimum.AAC.1